MPHSSDRFSITETSNPSTGVYEYLLRRLDKDDPQKTTDTFTLLPEEAMVLFTALLTEPKYREVAKESLVSTDELILP